MSIVEHSSTIIMVGQELKLIYSQMSKYKYNVMGVAKTTLKCLPRLALYDRFQPKG